MCIIWRPPPIPSCYGVFLRTGSKRSSPHKNTTIMQWKHKCARDRDYPVLGLGEGLSDGLIHWSMLFETGLEEIHEQRNARARAAPPTLDLGDPRRSRLSLEGLSGERLALGEDSGEILASPDSWVRLAHAPLF